MLVLNPFILPSVHPYHLGFDVQVTALFLKETLHSAANDADMMLEDSERVSKAYQNKIEGLFRGLESLFFWVGRSVPLNGQVFHF